MRWLAALSALGTIACIPVPQPMDPKIGVREIGADYSASAVGRWACAGTDVVVAQGPKGLLLHDLDLDVVASAPQAVEGGQRFVIQLTALVRAYVVPDDVTQPVQVTETVVSSGPALVGVQATSTGMQDVNLSLGGAEKVEARSCPPAEKVRLL